MRMTEAQLAAYLEHTGTPAAPTKVDTSAAPFALPPDIVLDLPPPISVNKLRRIDWTASKRLKEWKRSADNYVLAAKCRSDNPLKLVKIQRFELWITLSEAIVDIDADNSLKHLIDYLRRIELIENDAKKNMRGVHVVFGVAPIGCRVTVKALP